MFRRPKLFGHPFPLVVFSASGATPTFGAAGAVPGDLALVIVSNTSGGTPSGWAAHTYTWDAQTIVYSKVLTAGDISSPPTFNVDGSGGCTWNLFRSVTSVTLQTQHTQASSAGVTATWTPAANSAAFGILRVVNLSTSAGNPAITSPSGGGVMANSGSQFIGGGAFVLQPFTGSLTATPGSADSSIIVPFELTGV